MADTRRPVHDQVVIILGAASGIGRATALEFARRARLGSSSPPRRQGLATLVDELTQLGAEAVAVPTDITDTARRRRRSR